MYSDNITLLNDKIKELQEEVKVLKENNLYLNKKINSINLCENTSNNVNYPLLKSTDKKNNQLFKDIREIFLNTDSNIKDNKNQRSLSYDNKNTINKINNDEYTLKSSYKNFKTLCSNTERSNNKNIIMEKIYNILNIDNKQDILKSIEYLSTNKIKNNYSNILVSKLFDLYNNLNDSSISASSSEDIKLIWRWIKAIVITLKSCLTKNLRDDKIRSYSIPHALIQKNKIIDNKGHRHSLELKSTGYDNYSLIALKIIKKLKLKDLNELMINFKNIYIKDTNRFDIEHYEHNYLIDNNVYANDKCTSLHKTFIFNDGNN